jgi:2-polyprenyl-6-hydroxyphenyl methylase/3-demethylubiquinone-9 3-methyltransferase
MGNLFIPNSKQGLLPVIKSQSERYQKEPLKIVFSFVFDYTCHLSEKVNVMTSDPNEIEKFSQLAASWWDLNGPLKTLHHINPARLSYIEQYVSLSGKTVLDVGCGGGILSEALWQQGATVDAIDLDEKGITAAIAHQQQSNSTVHYQLSDITLLATQKPEHYDIITCMEMLEHVPHPEQIIQAFASLLKPDGYLFLSTINRTLKAYALAIIGAEYILRLLPRGTHDYQKFIKPSELTTICRTNYFSCINLQGLHYNPLTEKAQLIQNIDVNYLGCFKKDI